MAGKKPDFSAEPADQTDTPPPLDFETAFGGLNLSPEIQQAIQQQGQVALTTIDNLVIGGMRFTQTGLVPVKELTEDGLQLIGNVLHRFRSSFKWLVADFLNAADIYEWGQVNEVATFFGLKAKTLQNWKSISSNVPYSLRRERLDFNHHALVAYLSEDEQQDWLAKAERGDPDPNNPGIRKRWSVDRLRKEIAAPDTADESDTPPLLDKSHQRRMGRIWRNMERGTYQKIHRDDIYELRKWLDDAEKEIRNNGKK